MSKRIDETKLFLNFDRLWSRFGDGECTLVLLSEREVACVLAALRQAGWASRWYGDNASGLPDVLLRDQGREEELLLALEFVETLEAKLVMGCGSEIKEGLQEIAAAMLHCCASGRCGGAGGWCDNDVIGGSVDLSNPDNLVSPAASEGVGTIGQGEPPDGFDTWADYTNYKCEAANWVFDRIVTWLSNMAGLSAFGAVTAIVGPVLVAVLGPTLVLPPVTFVALLGAVIAFGLLGMAGFAYFNDLADEMENRRQTIVCRLYEAQNTTNALNDVLDEIEDIIEGMVTGGMSSALAPLMGQVVGELIDTSLLNTLFQLSLDVSYAGADCSMCVPCALENVSVPEVDEQPVSDIVSDDEGSPIRTIRLRSNGVDGWKAALTYQIGSSCLFEVTSAVDFIGTGNVVTVVWYDSDDVEHIDQISGSAGVPNHLTGLGPIRRVEVIYNFPQAAWDFEFSIEDASP